MHSKKENAHNNANNNNINNSDIKGDTFYGNRKIALWK